MLSTRTALKTHLSLTTTAEDAALDLWLNQASWAVRRYLGQYLGGVIANVAVGSPGVVTCPGHGLETGDAIVIAHSTTTPSLDGAHIITRLSDDTFTTEVNISDGGTTGAGTFARTLTEFYRGSGGRVLALRERPVQSIVNVWLDESAAFGEVPGAFGAETLLTAGIDYNLVRDTPHPVEKSRSGLMVRMGGVWPRPRRASGGLLVAEAEPANGNLKIEYTAGYVTLPADIQLAVHQLAAQLRRTATLGLAPASEQYAHYRYSVDLRGEEFASVRRLLARYKPMEW